MNDQYLSSYTRKHTTQKVAAADSDAGEASLDNLNENLRNPDKTSSTRRRDDLDSIDIKIPDLQDESGIPTKTLKRVHKTISIDRPDERKLRQQDVPKEGDDTSSGSQHPYGRFIQNSRILQNHSTASSKSSSTKGELTTQKSL